MSNTDEDISQEPPDLGELVNLITQDNVHPAMEVDDVGREVVDYLEDEELITIVNERLDQPETDVDIDDV